LRDEQILWNGKSPQEIADYGTLQYWLNATSIKAGYITLKQFIEKNGTQGVGADGQFSSMELLHFLYQCYKFKFYNYIYE
jgi:hypothetical protein